MNFQNYISTKSDQLNLILILVSALLAYFLPFSLFLFSYAVLGPLHYITEINWLNEKQFYVKNKVWVALFVVLCAIICIPVISHIPALNFGAWPAFAQHAISSIVYYSDILLLTLVMLSIGMTFLKSNWKIFFFLLVSILVSKLVLSYVFQSFIMVGLFLPTLVHVYVFTLLFILLGALNSKSKTAWINILLLLLAPIAVWFLPFDANLYMALEPKYSIDISQNFRFINVLAEFFGVADEGRIQSFSQIGLKIQTFVAFAYTYHYLNWFSKVYTIGWSKSISKSKLIFVLTLWCASLALFAYDYGIAYLALFFMALLHIVLEFPLNMLSIKLIYSKLKST